MEIKELSADEIVGSVYQPRQQPIARDRHRLMRSIKRNGLKVPIIVMRAPGGPYKLVSGHRRADALTQLLREGRESLPDGAARISRGKLMVHAVVLGAVDRKEAAFCGFIENHERVDLTPYEQACCYKTFVEQHGFTRKELAERADVGRTTLGSLIRALDGKSLTPAMIKSWKGRELQRGHVLALLRLSDRRTDQVALYKKILNEKLNVSMAGFWCERMLTPKERRLDRRSLDRLAKAFLADSELKEAIDDKELAVLPSRAGGRMDLRYSSTDDLESKLEAMLACVRRLGG